MRINDEEVKILTLKNMASKYGIKFSGDEIKKFAYIGSFGDSMTDLKPFVDQYSINNHPYLKGIPINNFKYNEFYNWILEARKANVQLYKSPLRFYVEGDQNEAYPIIKLVINNLQMQDINHFTLKTRNAN